MYVLIMYLYLDMCVYEEIHRSYVQHKIIHIHMHVHTVHTFVYVIICIHAHIYRILVNADCVYMYIRSSPSKAVVE